MVDAPTLPPGVLAELDVPTTALVKLAAIVAAGDEPSVRDALGSALAAGVPHLWIDELLLQSYLFSGFPRALNAAREWRRLVPMAATIAEEDGDTAAWRRRGERTCAAVYGAMYDKLRANVAGLHPALDELMVVDGYGKVLGRAGLDLGRRELCVVAACAATGQDRQLHSHLHGALNVGVAPPVLAGVIQVLEPLLGAERARSVRLLLSRVAGK